MKKKTDARDMRQRRSAKRRPWIIEFLAEKRNWFAIVSVVAAVSVVMFAVSAKNISELQEYRRYFDSGQDLYYKGEYMNALGCLRRASAIEKTDDCSILEADCYTAMQNYDKALEILYSLNVKDANVSSRIEKINDALAELRNNNSVVVAGRVYSKDTKTVVLSGLELSNKVISELTALYALENLSLNDNKLTDISALSSLGGLISLDLSGNSIEDISALSELSILRTLYLDDNPISDFSPLYSLRNLSVLSIKGIELSPEQLSELSKAMPDCAIHCESEADDVMDIAIGGISFKSDVKELDLSGLSLSDISVLSKCKELTKLILKNNSISDLSPLMDIPRLSYLDISCNDITDARPLMGMQRLSYLDISNNNVTSTVAIGALSALYELHIDANPISDFSGLRKLDSAGILTASDTGLKDSDLEYIGDMDALLSLDIRNNSALSGEAVDELRHKIISCTISSSDLPYSIVIGGKEFKNNDTNIDLSSLGLSDISQLTSFLRPERLKLSNNSISNIYNIQYCTTLKYLDLSGNLIEDVTPLGALSSLEELDLSNNFISNPAALYNLKRLRSLTLTGNKLTEEQLKALRSALPDCEIIS